MATVLVTTLAEGSVQQVVPASAARTGSAPSARWPSSTGSPPSLGPSGARRATSARRYLADRLRGAGLQVEVQHSVGVRSAAGLATFGRVDNIVATLPGRNPTGTVMLAAHYDSASMGPGASDDGASVAALLETVRALRGDAPLRNDLVVLITDGEEDGSIGAEAFIREHPLARHGGVVLNWEARGVDGPSLMFETSPGNADIVRLFTDSVPHPRGDSSLAEFYRALPNSSDFSTLRRAGFVGMNFAFVEGASRYHTASDSIANLEPGSLQHHGETMLALARAFGDADIPSLGADHDLVHFRLMGAEITYPDALVLPLAALAALLLVGLVALACARRAAGPGRIAVAALTAVIPLLLSVVLAQALWSFLVAVRPGYDLMGGLLHRRWPMSSRSVRSACSPSAPGTWRCVDGSGRWRSPSVRSPGPRRSAWSVPCSPLVRRSSSPCRRWPVQSVGCSRCCGRDGHPAL